MSKLLTISPQHTDPDRGESELSVAFTSPSTHDNNQRDSRIHKSDIENQISISESAKKTNTANNTKVNCICTDIPQGNMTAVLSITSAAETGISDNET